MDDSWEFSTLSCRFEAPDLVLVTITGKKHIDGDSIRALNAAGLEIQKRTAFPYWLFNLGTGATPDASARLALKQMDNPGNPFSMILYGGTLASRALILLIMRGLSLMGKMDTPMTVVKNEAEAREWVTAHRAKRAADAGR